MATVKEIRAELEAAGVEIPRDARKADLEELLEATVGETVTPIEAGGIDPRLVAAREEARKREPRVGRVRPVPATIDPRLVEERDRVVAEEARNRARPATEPPVR